MSGAEPWTASDIASQVAGSVGLAGSANIGDEVAMFEAVQPLWKQLSQATQKLGDSGYLTPALRSEMRSMIASMVGIYKRDYNALRAEYSSMIEGEAAVDPTKVMGEPYDIPDFQGWGIERVE